VENINVNGQDGSDQAGQQVNTLVNGIDLLAQPLEITAVNGTMFLVAEQSAEAGTASIVGGCFEPTPAEPLTCTAGVGAGLIAYGTAGGFAYGGVTFFKNYTWPAWKQLYGQTTGKIQ
jgi:hypothetical protein